MTAQRPQLEVSQATPVRCSFVRRLAAAAVFATPLLLGAGTALHAGDSDRVVAIGVTPEGVSCVLGGSIGGEIVAASRLVDVMTHGQDYTLVGLDGPLATAVAVGGARAVPPDADCEDQFEQELSIDERDTGIMQTAVLGTQDVIAEYVAPVTHITGAELEDLRLDIRVYLDESGFIYSGVELSQAMRFDANGDGKPEILINAINSQRGSQQRGEYALILLKDGASGQFRSLAEEFTDETSDFPSLLWENTVVSVIDLDGNGKMEIVLYGTFFYGDGWEVIEIGETKGTAVLGCGCSG